MPDATIQTFLWFDSNAEAAATLYCSLFEDGRITDISRQPDGAALVVAFTLNGQSFGAINGGTHYALTPAVSIAVHVDTQAEIDRLWDALLAGGGRESRCGWLTDRYGLSWQIVPRVLPGLLQRDPGGKVMAAMLKMVKLDIAALQAAADT